VANGAALAQCRVFENKRPRLLAMTLSARFVQARHRQSSCGLHDVQAVRIVAPHAIHLSFKNGMMLRKVKLGIDVQVALKTRLRILSRINDEFLPSQATDRYMLASWPVA
jgi:hypothetical protein